MRLRRPRRDTWVVRRCTDRIHLVVMSFAPGPNIWLPLPTACDKAINSLSAVLPYDISSAGHPTNQMVACRLLGCQESRTLLGTVPVTRYPGPCGLVIT